MRILLTSLGVALAACTGPARTFTVTLEPPAAAPAEETPSRTASLVEGLGSDDPDAREEATSALYRLGPALLPLLDRTAKSHPDPEVRGRAATIADAIRLSERGFTVHDEWRKDDAGDLGSYMIRRLDIKAWRVPIRFQNRGGEKGFAAGWNPDGVRASLSEIRRRAGLVEPLQKAIQGIQSEEIASFLTVLLLAIDDSAAANAFVEIAASRLLRPAALEFSWEFLKHLSRADTEHERRLIEAFGKTDALKGEQPLHRYLVWMGSAACVEALVRRVRDDPKAAANRVNALEALTEFASEAGFKSLLEILPTLTAPQRDRLKRNYQRRRDLDEIGKAAWFDGERLAAALR